VDQAIMTLVSAIYRLARGGDSVPFRGNSSRFSLMNSLSALFRLISGAVILIMTWLSWSKNKAAIAGGEPVRIAGTTIDAGAGTLTLAYAFVAVIALGLVLLGVVGLTTRKK